MLDKKTNQRNAKYQRHGEWIRLWGNKNIWWHSFFINGSRCGISKVYDPNGNLDQNRYYAR
jgi:antitoxin component YwqK of YwqJK toxin-antitoxin module